MCPTGILLGWCLLPKLPLSSLTVPGMDQAKLRYTCSIKLLQPNSEAQSYWESGESQLASHLVKLSSHRGYTVQQNLEGSAIHAQSSWPVLLLPILHEHLAYVDIEPTPVVHKVVQMKLGFCECLSAYFVVHPRTSMLLMHD